LSIAKAGMNAQMAFQHSGVADEDGAFRGWYNTFRRRGTAGFAGQVQAYPGYLSLPGDENVYTADTSTEDDNDDGITFVNEDASMDTCFTDSKANGGFGGVTTGTRHGDMEAAWDAMSLVGSTTWDSDHNPTRVINYIRGKFKPVSATSSTKFQRIYNGGLGGIFRGAVQPDVPASTTAAARRRSLLGR
jgi:hypothetical protein